MFNNLSKEEAVSGLLDTAKEITSDWLKANPDCKQTEQSTSIGRKIPSNIAMNWTKRSMRWTKMPTIKSC